MEANKSDIMKAAGGVAMRWPAVTACEVACQHKYSTRCSCDPMMWRMVMLQREKRCIRVVAARQYSLS